MATQVNRIAALETGQVKLEEAQSAMLVLLREIRAGQSVDSSASGTPNTADTAPPRVTSTDGKLSPSLKGHETFTPKAKGASALCSATRAAFIAASRFNFKTEPPKHKVSERPMKTKEGEWSNLAIALLCVQEDYAPEGFFIGDGYLKLVAEYHALPGKAV